MRAPKHWDDDQSPWLPWYAWHPVKITDGPGAGLWAWRKVILRKVIVISIRIPCDIRRYKDVPTKL